MKNRTFLLVISLLLALATAGAALFWLRSQGGTGEKPAPETELWTAAETIPAGTLITEKMIKKIKVPQTQYPAGAVTASEEIIGQYAKDTILQGEAFPAERLYSEGDQMLSMRLERGYRAYTVAMTQYSGVGDLVRPGDRVDIFAYLGEIEKNSVIIRPDIAQVVVQDLEVLAVRKETRRDDAPPEELDELYAVTVAAPVKEIEKLVLVGETGILKLALRPFEDRGKVTSYGVVWKELLLDSSLGLRELFPEYEKVEDLDRLNRIELQPESISEEAGQPTQGTAAPTGSETGGVAVAPPKDQEYIWYTVKTGDTLMSISRQFFGGSASRYDDIMRLNELKVSTIRPGQKLKIPTGGR